MKELADGTEIPDRGYHYLLDWNEKDGWRYIASEFGKQRLCDLTIVEYRKLFAYATKEDLGKLYV